MVNQLRNFFNYIAEQLKKFRRRLTKRRLSPPVILLPSLHGFEDLLLFNLCPCSPGQASLEGTAHLPGRQVQGFFLERVKCSELPVDLFSPQPCWPCSSGVVVEVLTHIQQAILSTTAPGERVFLNNASFSSTKFSWDKQKPGDLVIPFRIFSLSMLN